MSSAGSRARSWAAFAVEVGLWAALCIGVWLLTLSFVTGGDLILAALFGVLSGVAAAGARRITGSHWRFDPRWTQWLLAVPVATLIETPAVWWQAARRLWGAPEPSQLITERLPEEDAELAAGRRALAMTLTALTPGTLVVDVVDEQGRSALLEHRLVDVAPDWATIRPATTDGS